MRGNDPQINLPVANFIPRVWVQFGWVKSDWDQVWVGSGCQSRWKLSVVASACSLLGLGVCLFYALYTIKRDSTAVVVIRAWFIRMDMWTYVPGCA